MTALDHDTPLSAEKFAEIEDRNERAVRFAEDPAWPLGRAEFDRALLCDEVNRLTETAHNQALMLGEITEACMAAEGDALRHRTQVAELSAEVVRLKAALGEIAQRTVQRDLNRLARTALGEEVSE